MLASSISQGSGTGWPGSFVQGPQMAYSSASDVKSFAFCYCSLIVNAVNFISIVDEFKDF